MCSGLIAFPGVVLLSVTEISGILNAIDWAHGLQKNSRCVNASQVISQVSGKDDEDGWSAPNWISWNVVMKLVLHLDAIFVFRNEYEALSLILLRNRVFASCCKYCVGLIAQFNMHKIHRIHFDTKSTMNKLELCMSLDQDAQTHHWVSPGLTILAFLEL